MVERVPGCVPAVVRVPGENRAVAIAVAVTLPLLLRGQRRGALGAVRAQEAAGAELDKIAVEEERAEGVEVAGVGLQHAYPRACGLVVALVVVLRFEVVRNLGDGKGEGAQGGGESIFVAPPGTALGDESVKVLGAVVVVVGAEAEGLG